MAKPGASKKPAKTASSKNKRRAGGAIKTFK
jgi:hypothetical protein